MDSAKPAEAPEASEPTDASSGAAPIAHAPHDPDAEYDAETAVTVTEMFNELPLACRGPISRKTFTHWLDHACAVAQPESAPLLIKIALDGIDERRDGPLLDAVAWQLCETIGDEGLVSRLDTALFGVMVASEGETSADAVATRLLGALARPLDGQFARLPQGARLGFARWGSHGTHADSLFAAAAYALRDAEAVALPGAGPSVEAEPRRVNQS